MDLAYMAALPQEEFTERRQKVFAQIITTAIFLSVKTVTFGI